MLDLITGPLGQIIGAVAAALAVLWAAWRRGSKDATAKHRAQADKAALDTIRRVQDAQDASRAGGGDWHDRLRRDTRK